ncbi:MAG: 1-deoxy-D-xylulose-5-phosphate reductoisomerase [Candidatus Omnitrophica bacterium]|nr:1-deoxy-D-xylulose-5-phosphate reductoisomerase [Candidatus Omnitrophota bacterium]
MKRIAILGSTGSIGGSTLQVIKRHPDKFKAAALTTNSNIDLLFRQIEEFSPESVCVADEKAAERLKPRLKNKKTRLYSGNLGLTELISCERIDRIVLAITGSSALEPLLVAIDNRIDVALANKEALVMAGSIIMDRAHRHNPGALKKAGLKQVLKHPRWNMGPKITVDSATLMNKGFELLEAMALFGVSSDKIKILIHPEAICHSMVEFNDGVVMAQLSATDMRIPIQYALTFPERLESDAMEVDFCALKSLNFEEPDYKKFPCLELSLKAARQLGTMPAVLNAANEAAVNSFLTGNLKFFQIPEVVKAVMNRHKNIIKPTLDEIIATDVWAKQQAAQIIGKS